MASATPVTDPDQIRQWAEARGGRPACVKGTAALLRVDFGKPDEKLQPISWEQWFETFESRNLVALIQEGGRSRFIKLVDRGSASQRTTGRSTKRAGSTGRKSAVRKSTGRKAGGTRKAAGRKVAGAGARKTGGARTGTTKTAAGARKSGGTSRKAARKAAPSRKSAGAKGARKAGSAGARNVAKRGGTARTAGGVRGGRKAGGRKGSGGRRG
jgi:hypothetical protein